MMDWQKANGWWTYFIQGGSPDIGYPMRYSVGMNYTDEMGIGRRYAAWGYSDQPDYLADPRDPLILDVNGDGIKTTTLADGAYFDHDKNGFAEKNLLGIA